MDISKQFSLTDFSAYFFPGAVALVGIYFLLPILPAPFTWNIASVNLPPTGNITIDATIGLAFLILSYIVGVIISGFSANIVNFVEKITKYKDPHEIIPDKLLPDKLVKNLKSVLGIHGNEKYEWNRYSYYLCRSLVKAKMPVHEQSIEHQSNLALFRRNLVFPLVIWTVTCIGWGIWSISHVSQSVGYIIVFTCLLIFPVVLSTVIKRMQSCEKNKVRETLTAFITGYNLGLFDKNK